ncbi:glycosyl transferase [Paenibacillus odorifer]|uniref:Glycosyl transferase n=1 Tax=Paenibacillus odorifer TaxID=189426 RepID=A0A1R0ZA66_9BACL|nr:glycoside hydrolase family 99-like domain-containing protein [Paenibacillus odorifer]OME65263.1 glycosyl transferase [Paenibacillus odorifer]
MKIISFYLPQYHEVTENNEWWGKGFTEWVNVKNSIPRFKGHQQPRIPLNKNYYDLTDSKSLKWQADLAKEYGIYGFCYYHYWFEGHLLLEKPAEIMLQDKSIELPFCFCWANHTWRRTWANKHKTVLLEQTYGDKEDWENHFNYFLPFFKDDRYIKNNEKPMLVIYNPSSIDRLEEMLSLWNQLALENGLNGISYSYQENAYATVDTPTSNMFDYGIEYQPSRALEVINKSSSSIIKRTTNRIADAIPILRSRWTTLTYDYDKVWKCILNQQPLSNKSIPGAFVDWDDSPRRKNRGSVSLGVTPGKFKKYLSQQIRRTKEVYQKDMLFVFAWNEWGEGGYLEPDELHNYKMLEAVREALQENEE